MASWLGLPPPRLELGVEAGVWCLWARLRACAGTRGQVAEQAWCCEEAHSGLGLPWRGSPELALARNSESTGPSTAWAQGAPWGQWWSRAACQAGTFRARRTQGQGRAALRAARWRSWALSQALCVQLSPMVPNLWRSLFPILPSPPPPVACNLATPVASQQS